MLKKIVIPSSWKMIQNLVHKVDGFIVGIKELSVNLPFYVDNLEEVVTFVKGYDKEIFISLNKNIHNSELELLRETLFKLEKIGVSGVIYYDAGVVNIKRELNLNLEGKQGILSILHLVFVSLVYSSISHKLNKCPKAQVIK